MGSKKSRDYLENFARTLMGQLGITDDEVGIDGYEHDTVSSVIRKKLRARVFQDMRHFQHGTLARIVASFDYDSRSDQRCGEEFKALHNGNMHCTLQHINNYEDAAFWLAGFVDASPLVVLRHMAATIIVAVMYDLVVQKKKNNQPVAS